MLRLHFDRVELDSIKQKQRQCGQTSPTVGLIRMESTVLECLRAAEGIYDPVNSSIR
jgi:hypothetical protein